MNGATRNFARNVCLTDDLIEYSGVAVLLDGEQVALFYLPDESPSVYAISNYDPIGGANVLARGIVGDRNGRLVVASPLYKQHFDLVTGVCLEDPQVQVRAYEVQLRDGVVCLARANESEQASPMSPGQ